jgi:hypothetical protein
MTSVDRRGARSSSHVGVGGGGGGEEYVSGKAVRIVPCVPARVIAATTRRRAWAVRSVGGSVIIVERGWMPKPAAHVEEWI